MPLDRAMLCLARPLRRLHRQSPRLERMLSIDLPAAELDSVLEACSRSGVRLGDYYYWYFQKMLAARRFRGMDRRDILKRLSSSDVSDYDRLDALSDSTDLGLLIAIPHHAHYILSIVAMAERLRHRRRVLVFYGAPTTHVGNELFDDLYGVVFQGECSNVEVIHDTRAGLSSAIDGLKKGAAVIIMPDVHKHERDAYLLPFLGRPLNVMLGTAALARRTGSSILPCISRSYGHGLQFETRCEPLIPPMVACASDTSLAQVDVVHQDYCVTAKMFQAFESTMSCCIHHWQYARVHYQRKLGFPELRPEELESAAALLFDDPRMRYLQQAALHLSSEQHP